MVDKASSGSERLGRLIDRLAEYVQNAPGGELLEDARQEGRDPAKTTMRVKGLLLRAVKNHQQGKLMRAEEEYQREVAAMKARPINLPPTPEQRRTLLSTLFSQQPQLKAAFTFQNRGFSELTDQDVENHLHKLALLGILDEMQLWEDDE
ncbi:MAG: hypothetical protein LAO08_00215 [Acidobacteriia bacterium]|nr:hypothetical protein [Terriglobia bacterium]